MDRIERGRTGEKLAAAFLISQGYRILETNLRLKQGEIDILAQYEDEIVLVEVKSLERAVGYDPVERVGLQKRAKLALLAQIIASRYPDMNIRVDVITVYWQQHEPHITHFPNSIELI